MNFQPPIVKKHWVYKIAINTRESVWAEATQIYMVTQIPGKVTNE